MVGSPADTLEAAALHPSIQTLQIQPFILLSLRHVKQIKLNYLKKIGFLHQVYTKRRFRMPPQNDMEIQQRIGQQRVKHIVDSYLLAGSDGDAFNIYLEDLLAQYSSGLIELALVETLVKNWLRVPMQKGTSFLATAHERLKQWQSAPESIDSLHHQLSPGQFAQITGLDPEIAFAALDRPTAPAPQPAPD